MTRSITIIKNNHGGEEVWRYQGHVIAQSPEGLIAEAYFNRSDLDFNGLLLKENDRFLELYLFEKWFNIYVIFDRDTHKLKAWYCNITRPVRIEGDKLYYDDLALDLLVFPDGRKLTLDEDEFQELQLSNNESEFARAALKDLQQLFEDQSPLDIFTLI